MKFALVLVCGLVLIMDDPSIYTNAQQPQVVRGTVIGVGIPGIREIGPEELGGVQGKEGQAVGQGGRSVPEGRRGLGRQGGRGVRSEAGVTVNAEAGVPTGVPSVVQGGEKTQSGEQNGLHVGHNHTADHRSEGKGDLEEQVLEGGKRVEGAEATAAAEGAKVAGGGEVGVSVTPAAAAVAEGTPEKDPVAAGAKGAAIGKSTKT